MNDAQRATCNSYFLMRHGEAVGNDFGIIDSGNQHFPLTADGRIQVEETAKKLAEKKIDLIFTSDLDRTKETAEITAKALGVKTVHKDARLREINLAALSGTSLEEYHKRPVETGDPLENHAVLGAESLADVRKRAWEFLKEMEEKHHGKNILVVTHEDTIWMLSQAAEGWSERKTAGMKAGKNGIFISPADFRELRVKQIPRNDTGLADLHRPYIDEITFPCSACEGTMSRTSEIFDSWMEAGSMPFAEYHYPFENKEKFEKKLSGAVRRRIHRADPRLVLPDARRFVRLVRSCAI